MSTSSPVSVHAAIVARSDGGAPAATYLMYDARDVGTAGAFFHGALLLEPDEQVLVQLTFGDGSSLRVQARVERVQEGEDAGMAVSFVELGEADRAVLASKLRSAAGQPSE
jgi:hypothetical protein